MGTRHKQTVIDRDGNMKIAQYGQWDGYPSGQGVDILNYLKSGDLDKYQQNLINIPEITQEQIDEVNQNDKWDIDYPYLSRNCGSDIHQMIENGSVKFVSFIPEEEARKWCEGFYTINFKDSTFTVEYYDKTVTYKLDSLPSEEDFLAYFEDEDSE